MIKLILFCTICLIGCNNQDKLKVVSEKTKLDSLHSDILGYWGGLGKGEDRPVWKIEQDTIQYLADTASYRYQLFEDSLVIYFPGHSGALYNVQIIKDTMRWKDDLGLNISAYRFPNKDWQK